MVKKAEAEAESKALQGQGIANQRKAIIEGLQARSSNSEARSPRDHGRSHAARLVTQYFDTLKSIGERTRPIRCSCRIRPARPATFPSRSCSRC